MSFALLSRSLSHTRWYWSVSQNFTQKSERQFTWESAADLAADYPKLRSHYPTLFAKKRAEAFWIYDLAHDDATQLSLAAADSADVPADDAPQAETKNDKTIAIDSPTAVDSMALQTNTSKQQGSDPKTPEHFALMVDGKNNASCYYSRTLKNSWSRSMSTPQSGTGATLLSMWVKNWQSMIHFGLVMLNMTVQHCGWSESRMANESGRNWLGMAYRCQSQN